MRFAKPLDKELLLQQAAYYGQIITLEEGCLAGGVGSAVLEALNEAGLLSTCRVHNLGIPDEFVLHGDKKLLLRDLELDVESIARKAALWAKEEDR